MSANYFARAVRPFGRSSTATTTGAVSGRARFFTTSAFRRNVNGKRISAAKTASTWTGASVLAIAAAAGLLGWSVATISVKGFPGAMHLDSKIAFPKYASMRDMELVGFCGFEPVVPLSMHITRSFAERTTRL